MGQTNLVVATSIDPAVLPIHLFLNVMKRLFVLPLLALGGLLVLPACDTMSAPSDATSMEQLATDRAAGQQTQSIAEIAINNGNFSTLVAALVCADLGDAVSGSRQLTVFAPTDDAFADLELDADNVCELGAEALAPILLYHVVPGSRAAQSVLPRTGERQLQTLAGGFLTVSTTGRINDAANVVAADIFARNGVIHVIDAVLLP
jgi:uncharacterized surface protein with fasciclin (FAS1) repeats